MRARGFTLIEVLLVIAILAILAAVVIIAINPAKQLGEAQNAQRRSDVRSILDAVYQYSIDNNGALPGDIDIGGDGETCISSGNMICKESEDCGAVQLDELVSNDRYMVDLPADPKAATEDETGYSIYRASNGRISVCALNAYGDEEISVTR
jgi:prepilin-type N-terminal cleavage/methylation domain-containing protein